MLAAASPPMVKMMNSCIEVAAAPSRPLAGRSRQRLILYTEAVVLAGSTAAGTVPDAGRVGQRPTRVRRPAPVVSCIYDTNEICRGAGRRIFHHSPDSDWPDARTREVRTCCGLDSGRRPHGDALTLTTIMAAASSSWRRALRPGRRKDRSGLRSRRMVSGQVWARSANRDQAESSIERGVSSKTIHVAVFNDASNTAEPGLDKEFLQQADAFADWCNASGGINGRHIVVDDRDGALFNAAQVTAQACQSDFMAVGGGLVLDQSAVPVQRAMRTRSDHWLYRVRCRGHRLIPGQSRATSASITYRPVGSWRWRRSTRRR